MIYLIIGLCVAVVVLSNFLTWYMLKERMAGYESKLHTANKRIHTACEGYGSLKGQLATMHAALDFHMSHQHDSSYDDCLREMNAHRKHVAKEKKRTSAEYLKNKTPEAPDAEQ